LIEAVEALKKAKARSVRAAIATEYYPPAWSAGEMQGLQELLISTEPWMTVKKHRRTRFYP